MIALTYSGCSKEHENVSLVTENEVGSMPIWTKTFQGQTCQLSQFRYFRKRTHRGDFVVTHKAAMICAFYQEWSDCHQSVFPNRKILFSVPFVVRIKADGRSWTDTMSGVLRGSFNPVNGIVENQKMDIEESNGIKNECVRDMDVRVDVRKGTDVNGLDSMLLITFTHAEMECEFRYVPYWLARRETLK